LVNYQLSVVSVVAFCLAISGCGTVTNIQQSGPPYGGVREAAAEGLSRAKSAGDGRCIPPFFDYLATGYWWFIDVPVSTIADTLTLPLTFLPRNAESHSESKP